MELPNIVKVRRNFEDNAIQDIEGCVKAQLENVGIKPPCAT